MFLLIFYVNIVSQNIIIYFRILSKNNVQFFKTKIRDVTQKKCLWSFGL